MQQDEQRDGEGERGDNTIKYRAKETKKRNESGTD